MTRPVSAWRRRNWAFPCSLRSSRTSTTSTPKLPPSAAGHRWTFFAVINPRIARWDRHRGVLRRLPLAPGPAGRGVAPRVRAPRFHRLRPEQRWQQEFSGWQARIVQHETDHLQGVCTSTGRNCAHSATTPNTVPAGRIRTSACARQELGFLPGERRGLARRPRVGLGGQVAGPPPQDLLEALLPVVRGAGPGKLVVFPREHEERGVHALLLQRREVSLALFHRAAEVFFAVDDQRGRAHVAGPWPWGFGQPSAPLSCRCTRRRRTSRYPRSRRN